MDLPVDRCPVCDGRLERRTTGRRRVYCSNRCRQQAKRERRGSAELAAEPLEPEPVEAFLVGRSAPIDDQVLAAVHETLLLVVTFRRLSHESRRQFAWRCAGMAEQIDAALARYFKAPS